MDTTTTLHITIDRETKQKAQALAKELGLDISTVVRASLRQFVRTESFSVERSYRMTPYLEKLISDAKAESAKNSGAEFGSFENSDDAAKFLRSRSWK
jgi:addiction module RelB/DinJ family antitoxin